MLRMLNLIRNENMKTFRRISTLVMIGVLIMFVGGIALKTKVESYTEEKGDWKAGLLEENKAYKGIQSQPGIAKSLKDQYEKMIRLNDYRIEHDIPPLESGSLWGFVDSQKNTVVIISLFIIIIGGSAVANEFSSGTIKLLLIRPNMRWKVLLSKYLSTMFSALLMLITLFVSSFLIGSVFFGFQGISQPYLAYSNGVVRETNMVLSLLGRYGFSCVDMLMMVTFSFMISTVFRSNALAIGLSVFLMLVGNSVVGILSRYDWVKYILFANTDLSQYTDGVPMVKGMTMTFSIIVLAVYFVVFNLISWTTFIKRDVAA